MNKFSSKLYEIIVWQKSCTRMSCVLRTVNIFLFFLYHLQQQQQPHTHTHTHTHTPGTMSLLLVEGWWRGRHSIVVHGSGWVGGGWDNMGVGGWVRWHYTCLKHPRQQLITAPKLPTHCFFESIPTEEGLARFTSDGIEVVSQGPISTHSACLAVLHLWTFACWALSFHPSSSFTEHYVLRLIRAACHLYQMKSFRGQGFFFVKQLNHFTHLWRRSKITSTITCIYMYNVHQSLHLQWSKIKLFLILNHYHTIQLQTWSLPQKKKHVPAAFLYTLYIFCGFLTWKPASNACNNNRVTYSAGDVLCNLHCAIKQQL